MKKLLTLFLATLFSASVQAQTGPISSGSQPPSGSAGGSLTGTYPSPGLNLAGTNTGVLPSVNGGTGEAGTFTGARKANSSSADTAAACADLSNASVYCPAAVGQIPATTSGTNVPAAGTLWEPKTVYNSSPVSLTANTVANAATLSLTAGNWFCNGNAIFAGGATTTVTYAEAGISTSSGVLPSNPFFGQIPAGSITPFVGSNTFSVVAPSQEMSVTSAVSVFLVAEAGFTNSTAAVTGGIQCYRTP